MKVKPRFAEKVAGLSAIALYGCLHLDWFGPDIGPLTMTKSVPGHADVAIYSSTAATGWESLGWLALALCIVALLAGLALPAVFSFVESPVLPVAVAIITMLLGGLAAIALIVQVIFQPGEDSQVAVMSGWWLGFLAACGIARGGFLSVRDEYLPGVPIPDVELRPAPAA